ncbi:MAG: hypothetical protein ACRDKL_02695, partial [Solirubrobacteraceae bacterium]
MVAIVSNNPRSVGAPPADLLSRIPISQRLLAGSQVFVGGLVSDGAATDGYALAPSRRICDVDYGGDLNSGGDFEAFGAALRAETLFVAALAQRPADNDRGAGQHRVPFNEGVRIGMR